MLHTILLIILFWAEFFGITMILHYIYNIRMWSPKPFGYLDNYPFKCFRCCTTWVLIASYLMMGILLADVIFTIFGITLSSLYGFGLYKNEKERFINEDDGKRDMEDN